MPISFGLSQLYSPQLPGILYSLLQKKKNGAPIVNPQQYFEDILASLKQTETILRMDCDIGKYALQVSIRGKVYVCSKLKEETETNFLEIDKNYFKDDFHQSKRLLARCSFNCWSACAYGTNFFRKHPLSFFSTYGKI